MTLLSVNLNKIAVLRNSRGGDEPDIATAANTCIDAGCGGLTVHPRPDMRHVTPADVRVLAGLLRGRVEYNIEGNPFAGPRGAYPGLIELAREVRPTQVTLVPDAGGEGFAEAAAIGVQRIELYTGPYAEAFAEGDARKELASFADTAQRAQRAGLAVNAGHDLSQANLGTFKSAIPGLAEVSIGHALIGEALYEGLSRTVKNYLSILS